MPSSVIKTYRYDSSAKRLRIVFLSGKVYDYLGVPEHLFRKMTAFRSKGRFLNLFIKGRYRFKKVEKEL